MAAKKSKTFSKKIKEHNLTADDVATVLKIRRGSIGRIIIEAAIGAALGGIGNISALHVQKVLALLQLSGILIVLPMFGLFLFWMRQRYRLIYGMAEIVFGYAYAVSSMASVGFNLSEIHANDAFKTIACLYIMVRGLDNLGTAIKGTSLEGYWVKLFRST